MASIRSKITEALRLGSLGVELPRAFERTGKGQSPILGPSYENVDPISVVKAGKHFAFLDLGADPERIYETALSSLRLDGEDGARVAGELIASLKRGSESSRAEANLVLTQRNESGFRTTTKEPSSQTVSDCISAGKRILAEVGNERLIDLSVQTSPDYADATIDFLLEGKAFFVDNGTAKPGSVMILSALATYRLSMVSKIEGIDRVGEILIYVPRQNSVHSIKVSSIKPLLLSAIDRRILGIEVTYETPVEEEPEPASDVPESKPESVTPDVPVPHVSHLTSAGDLPYFALKLDLQKSFSYLEYHTDATVRASDDKVGSTSFGFIRKLSIDNHTDKEYQNVCVDLTFSSPIFSPLSIDTGRLKPLSKTKIEYLPPLDVDSRALYELTGVTYVNVKALAVDPESGEVLASEERTVRVLPLEQSSEWNRFRNRLLMAKYVTTEFPEMKEIHHEAIVLNHGEPLLAYIGQNRDAVVREAKLVFDALHAHGLSYSNPPQSSERFQNVRLPSTCLRDRLGTCLDLAILYASALLEVGIHPLLCMIEGHAFAGFFLSESGFLVDGHIEAPGQAYTMATGSSKKLVFVETTFLDASNPDGFQAAVSAATDLLKGYRGDLLLLDVHYLQNGYVKPIPLPREDGRVDFQIKPVELRKEDVEELLDFTFEEFEGNEKDRFSTWERKLLDLTTANRLVNFRFSATRNNFAEVIVPKAEDFYSFLQRGDGKLSVKPYGTYGMRGGGSSPYEDPAGKTEKDASIAVEEMARGGILCLSGDRELKNIVAADRSAREESGSPTLYLAIGILKTYVERKLIHAPFLLLPIEMSKNRLGGEFSLEYDFDDILVNETFFEYVRAKQGADYSYMYGFDPASSWKDLVSNLRENDRADIVLEEDFAFIANFTFAHYVMWKDVRERKKELSSHPIVSSLLENESKIENTDVEGEKTADELDRTGTFIAPMSYDSTQLKAILSSMNGNSFILDGPPGTGKSQTIVNMIVNAISNGKTVLFVAEKKAALDVVYDRLSRLRFNGTHGLGDFALVLASKQANKRSFFDALGRSMELSRLVSDGNFLLKSDELERRKKEIREELDKAHGHENSYLSFYEALSMSLDRKKYRCNLSFDEVFTSTYNGEKDAIIREEIARLESLVAGVEGYPDCPSSAFLFDDISPNDAAKSQERIISLLERYRILVSARKGFLRVADFESPIEFASLKDEIAFGETLFDTNVVPDALFDCDVFDEESKGKAFFDTLESYQATEIALDGYLSTLNRDAYPVDDIKPVLDECGNAFKWFFKGGKARKLAKPFLKVGVKANRKVLSEIDPLIRRRSHTLGKLRATMGEFEPFLVDGDDLRKVKLDESRARFEATKKAVEASRQYDFNATLLDSYAGAKSRAPFKRAFKDYADAVGAFFESLSKYNDIYRLDVSLFDGRSFDEVMSSLSSYLANPVRREELLNLAKINRVGNRLGELGVGQLFTMLRKGEIRPGNLLASYEYGLSSSFLLYLSGVDRYHRDFDAAVYEGEIERYRDLVREMRSLSIAEAAEKITSRFFRTDMDYSSRNPIGQLRKLVNNGGRGVTIRRALREFEGYFRTYFPCFLMSPLSAAQYLSLDSRKFDLVIFDEASQIPTAEAVGPIARGKSLIVAGDPEQMPPSDYFKASLTAYEDEEEEFDLDSMDAESLLDDCLSIGLPRIRLSFHYRSRHESLIEWSNSSFYDGDLFTFPSVDNREPRITHIHVEKNDHKTVSKISDEELRVLKETVVSILKDPKRKGKSVGIIVFNTTQQKKVVEMFDVLFETNPSLAERAKWYDLDSDSRMFVKNLENVQGDERDIIVLSIGFGKTLDGKARLGGPLVAQKGERRLNVAASRAKEEMFVVSTIRSSEIAVDRRKNEGAAYLKAFLAYVEGIANSRGVDRNLSDGADPIASFVARKLVEKGYEVDYGVGHSEFKVDLAVRKRGASKYSLGIVFDGEGNSRNLSTRDRFEVEPGMLLSLGWDVMMVYSYQVAYQPTKTIESILKRLERGPDRPVNQSAEKKETAAPILEKKAMNLEIFGKMIIHYRPQRHSDYSYYEPGTIDYQLINELKMLLDHEYPVSFSRACAIFKEYFLISRMGRRAEDALILHLRSMGCGKTQDYGGEIFYWPKMDFHTAPLSEFRVGRYSPFETSKEEMAIAIKKILDEYKYIDREDLRRALLRLYSQERMTEQTKDKLDYCIDYAKRKGILDGRFVERYPDGGK